MIISKIIHLVAFNNNLSGQITMIIVSMKNPDLFSDKLDLKLFYFNFNTQTKILIQCAVVIVIC